MKKVWIYILLLLPLGVYAQNAEDARVFAETITVEDLKDHLTIVASDAFEGRETGTRGQKIAAAYIKAHFESLGLAGPVDSEYGDGYYQRVPLYTTRSGDSYLKTGDSRFEVYKDMVSWGQSSTGEEKEVELVFAGEGTNDEIDGLDLEGKAALIMGDSWRSVLRGGAGRLAKAGADVVIGVVHEDLDSWSEFVSAVRPGEGYGRLSLDKPSFSEDLSGSIMLVSPDAAETMMGMPVEEMKSMIKDFKPSKRHPYGKVKTNPVKIKTEQMAQLVKSENVLGYLEGTDLKDELVILTAHYDHIGRRGEKINNGADDDGSGTVTILELAEAFVKAKKEGKSPRRSILFMTVTGEEKGLRGSDYYTRNPVFPLENTVVNLNIDMIGRIDPKHEDNPDYVYLVGSDRLSSELHEISEKANETFTSLELDYTYNDEGHPDRIYYRSDHWNFAKNNIPIIFYFTGIHDDYHQPSDTVDKIEFELLEKRAHLVYYTAWILANRDDRVVVDKVKDTTVEER